MEKIADPDIVCRCSVEVIADTGFAWHGYVEKIVDPGIAALLGRLSVWLVLLHT